MNKVIQDIARHESGHYVVGRCFGFKMGGIGMKLLNLSGAHHGQAPITLMPSLHTLDEVQRYAEQRVIILYAGSLAEACYMGDVNNDAALDIIRNKGGQDDKRKAAELIHVLVGLRYPNHASESDFQMHLDEIDQELWVKATQLVRNEIVTINQLAQVLSNLVQSINVEYFLPSQDIQQLTFIQERFGSSS